MWLSFLITCAISLNPILMIDLIVLWQAKPVFIGISRRELNVRPTAFFFIKCSLESKEVEKLYGSAQDGFESTHLYAISKVILWILTSAFTSSPTDNFLAAFIHISRFLCCWYLCTVLSSSCIGRFSTWMLNSIWYC